MPGPDVARPELRDEAQRRGIGTAVIYRQLHQDVVDAALGVFDLDVEITLVVEDRGIDQLELRFLRGPAAVLLDQRIVGKRALRISIKHPHVGMGRRTVDVVIQLLDVFAVIALGIGQPEQPLLQDRIALVPQRNAEAQVKMVVAKTADAVLAPAIGAAARVIVRQIIPSIAIGAVVLAHRSPLPVTDIGTPAPPRRTEPGVRQPAPFGGVRDPVGSALPAAWHHRSR